jgi:Putative zinc-finger
MSRTDEHPGELLTAYLDDELSGEEARAVEAHLVACGRCSAELDELSAARRLLRGLPPVPAPPGFTRELIERRRRSTRRGAALAVAAAGVAMLAGFALAQPADHDEPSRSDTLALRGDASRLDVTLGSDPAPAPTPSRSPQPPDEPLMAQGGDAGTTTAPSTATTSPPSTTTTTSPPNDTGSEEDSDPETVGDRIDKLATNLMELIGG